MTNHEIILADLTVAQCELRRLLSKAEAFNDISSRFVDDVMPEELIHIMCEVYQVVETSTEGIGIDLAKGVWTVIVKIIKFIVELIKDALKFVFTNVKKVDMITSRLNSMRKEDIQIALDNMNHMLIKDDAFTLLESASYFNSGLPTLIEQIKKGWKEVDSGDIGVALRLLSIRITDYGKFAEYVPGAPSTSAVVLIDNNDVATNVSEKLTKGRWIVSHARSGSSDKNEWTTDLFKNALFQLSSLYKGTKSGIEKRIQNQAEAVASDWTKANRGQEATDMLAVVAIVIQVHMKVLMHLDRHLTRMGMQVISGSPVPKDASKY